MRALALACYLLGTVAELVGFVLVVWTLREHRRILREWMAANPQGNAEGSWAQVPLLNKVIPALLDNAPRRPMVAALCIAVGIVAGSVGSIASLWA